MDSDILEIDWVGIYFTGESLTFDRSYQSPLSKWVGTNVLFAAARTTSEGFRTNFLMGIFCKVLSVFSTMCGAILHCLTKSIALSVLMT